MQELITHTHHCCSRVCARAYAFRLVIISRTNKHAHTRAYTNTHAHFPVPAAMFFRRRKCPCSRCRVCSGVGYKASTPTFLRVYVHFKRESCAGCSQLSFTLLWKTPSRATNIIIFARILSALTILFVHRKYGA